MSAARPAAYVVKAAIDDPAAACFTFARAKTMYGGKTIAIGDPVFLFASENEGGLGLVAAGVVRAVEAIPRAPGPARQTPRVSITVERVASGGRPLGRAELKRFVHWKDDRPETELNFKLYRQATDKIVGVSAEVAAFLRDHLSIQQPLAR